MHSNPAAPTAAKPSWRAALRQSIAYIRRTLGLVWRSSPVLTLTLAVLTLVGAFLPPAIAWIAKRIVDAVVAGSQPDTLRWVLLELGLVVLQATCGRALGLVHSVLGSRLGTDINVAILERATRLELVHFEDPEFYDRLSRARREASSRPVSLVTQSFSLVQSVLTLLGYSALVSRFSLWAVLGVLLATVPATLAEMRYSKTAFRLRNWRSPDSRRLMYLEYVLANDEHAKEVKLFGLGPLFLGRYKALAERFFSEDSQLALRRTLVTHALTLIATLAFYAAYALMAVAAAVGRLSIGSLTMYVLAFRNGQQSFQAILNSIGNIYEHNLYMSNLFEYLDMTDEARSSRTPSALVPSALVTSALVTSGLATPSALASPNVAGLEPSPDERGIRLQDVGFLYPGKTDWVLRHVNLFIPHGQSVALVGENGAGKTTLVKLLTRLYRPTEGRILLDGKDLADWDLAALHARFAVVFQDFNQYQLEVRQNVGLGSIEHIGDEPRVLRAVSRGGAEAVVGTLGKGLDTPLGRWFADGVELSGGQWQKVALARAFMREQADVLVLDEPTAALDAEAEHAVFQRFAELAKGRTTLIISHRFPTVRMADRILVLGHGQVIEDGDHAQLVARGGTYARLYQLQASGYV
ncbi:MAG TPA: ABC transporter ATP-binding protein [Polyangiaceae bacterium]|nr:ABC transporter ATP-binding protein [Polyangiaceae bacterium]